MLKEELSTYIDLSNSSLVGYILGNFERFPLLTEEEEVATTVALRKSEIALQEAGSLSVEQRAELSIQRASSKHKLICCNMRLVVPTAKFYAEKCKGKKDITFEDLIQEGMFGLMRATEKFDPHRGYKFSTYASRWIRQKISRYILNKGNTVRVPIYEQELLQERAKENYTIFSTQQLRNMQLAHNAIHVLELDHPLEEGSTETLAEVIADSTSETWQSIFSDFTQEEIQSLFERVLTSKEEIILKLYFGFGGAEPLTSEAIGERYGVTKQMINFFKLRALQKLRDHLDTQDYTIESFT